MRRNRIFTFLPAPGPTTFRSIPFKATNGGCSPKPKSWRWLNEACPVFGRMASTMAGCRIICSGSRSRTIHSAAFMKCKATAPTSTKICGFRHHHQSRMVSAESAVTIYRLGPAQQRQYPGIGPADRFEPSREIERALPRKLLDEKQARC